MWDAEKVSEVGDEELLEIVDDELDDQDEDSEVNETEHSDVSFDSGPSDSTILYFYKLMYYDLCIYFENFVYTVTIMSFYSFTPLYYTDILILLIFNYIHFIHICI